MDVLVTGASGLIGSALLPALVQAGHRPVRLTRAAATDGEVGWDPNAGTIDATKLDGIGAVIHLAGAGIGDHRWTDQYKREILESRTKGTDLLARTLASLSNRPSVLLSGSAIGFYGDRGDEELTEQDPAGSGFLAEVCVAWEAATKPAEDAGIRVAHLRTGIVLSTKGGALKKQLPLFKAFVGGRFGSGDQWQSWISIDDEVAAIVHLLDHDVRGPVNLTAPNPVTNTTFTKTLGNVLKRPTAIPIPSFGPKLLLGSELADSLLFSGQRVLPGVLDQSEYAFRHPELDGALRSLLGIDLPTA